MIERFDVLGLGCVTIDEFLYVPRFPKTDEKMQVNQRGRQCGGLTATALVAASRLGARCQFAGTLGDNELSQFVLDQLNQEGVGVTHVFRKADAQPIHAVIIVDESDQSRTILYDNSSSLGSQDEWPAEEVIRATRVLFVDHYGVEGMVRAARIARDVHIPVVADFERLDFPGFPKLLELVDHLVLSSSFASKLTGRTDPAVMAKELWSNDRTAVIITCGDQGCWHLDSASDEPQHTAAYQVNSVDTTGCGDVFHGAYASALARRLDLHDRIHFASAAAAMKATRRGGQTGIPSRVEVERFIEERDH